MQLGVALPHVGPHATPQAIALVARAANRLGFDPVWVVDRLLRPTNPVTARPGTPPTLYPAAFATVYDPIATLTWVAAQTEKVKLGTSVVVALWQTPVVLARRFATLDRLGGGRVIAALGQGLGLEEFVAAMRAAWGPDPVRFEGRTYTIAESEIGPMPVQPGGPPILMGAMTPAGIERAARIADGFVPSLFGWDRFTQSVAAFRDAARAHGRDPATLPVVVGAGGGFSDAPLGDDRAPLTGSPEQVAVDLDRLRALAIDHVAFDFNLAGIPPADQIPLMARLRAAVPFAAPAQRVDAEDARSGRTTI